MLKVNGDRGMTSKSLSMEMANLICRFGDKKVLLDLAEEVVVPAFLDKSLVRSYDKTHYFFYEASLVVLDGGEDQTVIGIAGRFIKDTTLVREQVFKEKKGLVKDLESMQSSPSAIFLLILNNHRLVYVKETRNAPSKDTFGATLLNFLRVKHKIFIDDKYQNLKKIRSEQPELPRTTKKSLYVKYPKPSLDIIALTSEDSIETFIRKYDVLKVMEISFSDRNDELDNDPFFEELQKRKDAVGSKKSIVKHRNSKGLNKDVAIEEIAEATVQGNQAVTLEGTDNDGDILRGNNEQFQLRKPLDNLSSDPGNAAHELYRSFVGLVNDGLISVPEISEKASISIESIIRRFR